MPDYSNTVIVPWVVNGFFKLITPFIDPLTRQKLKFNDDMRQHVPPQQLWNEFQGDLEFEYDHATYWPTLLKLCEEKQAEHRERWVKGGKQYGESEVYIKGGAVPSIVSPPPYAEKGKDVAPVESTQTPDTVLEAVPETKPAEALQNTTEVKAPVQSHGTQANGNIDVAAEMPDPVLTTEGDKA